MIKDGTVIDHIEGGQAPNVQKILKIEAGTTMKVSIAINVPSKTMPKKDIVKIEGRVLDLVEVNKIAIIAPEATINIIKDTKAVSKNKVKLPEVIEGIIKCQNPGCITNDVRPDEPSIHKEPIITKFYTRIQTGNKEPSFQCHYCSSIMTRQETIKALI